MHEQIDAFTLDWRLFNFYAFPPFSVVPRALQKIQTDQANGILVVPNWPTQPWYPKLMNMLVDNPVITPISKAMLRLPSDPELFPANYHVVQRWSCFSQPLTEDNNYEYPLCKFFAKWRTCPFNCENNSPDVKKAQSSGLSVFEIFPPDSCVKFV